MPKPTKYATPICLVLSVLAAIGIIVGIIYKNPLWIVILLLPAVAYEAYRTEGSSTKTSSIFLLLLLIAETICVIFDIKFNLANYLGQNSIYFSYSYLPLGEVTVMFPVIMAILSIILFTRTIGIYTKWLAAIIFISMIATIYLVNPGGYKDLIQFGTHSIY